MRIVGLDLSLTSTGLAEIQGGAASVQISDPGRRRGHERLHYQYQAVRRFCQGADLIVAEGPAFSRQKQHTLGGLWWIVMHVLWTDGFREYGSQVVVAGPTQVKQYALGKGSGKGTDKDHVLAAVVRRYPQVPVSCNDEADALVLAAMGADAQGCPLVPVPATHRAALDKWPYSDYEGLAVGEARGLPARPRIGAPARQ